MRLLLRLGLASVGLYAALGRRAQLSWGATSAETTSTLPGDDLMAGADLTATRGITIRAGVEDVWPWLAQMGQERGGFYSYDWLENLAGCQVTSADVIEPAWQHPRAGDDFRLHPDLCLTISLVDPPQALVVAGLVDPERSTGEPPAVPYEFTWAFVLVPQGTTTTRLLVRERYRYLSPVARPLVEVMSLVSFVMTERLMRGVRARSQGKQHA